ncbi:MAG: DUF58 domain-containing protein [Planctomycetes bacterium]|nr:DUF58 domain-containing protein [Planctomycetota bacterium]MCW8134173.1 DUF58 domain-containing protein [Planctomycetota bacterium]
MKPLSKGRLGRLARRLAVLPVPTRLGWYFLGASLLLFTAGSYYRENSFILLSCIPFALLVINAIVVWLNVRGLSLRRELPAEAHAGENFEVGLLLLNHGPIPRFALELDDTRLPDLYRDESANLVMAVSPGYVQRCGYSAAMGRRGKHRLKQCTVSSAFPFGLMRMARVLSFRSDILVYPRPARLSEHFEQRLLAAARFFGESSVASRGQEEVYGVREYLPGQNVARIHWRTTARTGKPMILELEGRHDASFVLILDTAPVGDPGTLRQRLEAAIGLFAGLTYFLTRQGVLFRFAWYGSDVSTSRAGRGDAHYHAVMEKLAHAGLAEKRLGEWIDDVGVGAQHEVPVLVTLGAKEHAEAALGASREAIVVSASEPDFKQYLRFDALGRRGVAPADLPRQGKEPE